jgi:hypothetical protein
MIIYSTKVNGPEGRVDDIPFSSHVVNSAGVSITLWPRRGQHTVSDVAKAKRQLRNERDVVHFYVEWEEPIEVIVGSPIGA